MRKNSIKNTRINGEVQKELSTIIRNEVKDPRIHPMTSVMLWKLRLILRPARHLSVSWATKKQRTQRSRA